MTSSSSSAQAAVRSILACASPEGAAARSISEEQGVPAEEGNAAAGPGEGAGEAAERPVMVTAEA